MDAPISGIRTGGGGGFHFLYGPEDEYRKHKKAEEVSKTVLQSLMEVVEPGAPLNEPLVREISEVPINITTEGLTQAVAQLKMDAAQLLTLTADARAQQTPPTIDDMQTAMLEAQLLHMKTQIVAIVTQIGALAYELEVVRDDGEALFLIGQATQGGGNA